VTATQFPPVRNCPDKVILGRPFGEPVGSVVSPHPDKAISQRVTILGAIAQGTSRISNLTDCADTRANLAALRGLGCVITQDRNEVRIAGRGWDEIVNQGGVVDAGNSATTARLLLALLAGTQSRFEVRGNSALSARPMSWLVEPLRTMGAGLTYLDTAGHLPIRVVGCPLHGARLRVEVDSAQPVSALLLAGLAADGPTVIHRRVPARDHTERLLRWTGVSVAETHHRLEVVPRRPDAFDLRVPGDPSAAAVIVALHLASPHAGTELTIQEVGLNPRRLGFFRMLRQMGIPVSWETIDATGPEPLGVVRVHGGQFSGGVVSGRELIQAGIDELPLLAALATAGSHPLVVRDAAELREKDTDRIATTVALLRTFGGIAEETEDGFVVHPSTLSPPGRVRFPADHRLVFAGCVLALRSGGQLEVSGLAAASISHPGLFDDLARFVPLKELV
jgi:3-phosphoshikimate 1-carboxyvinyltransferase